MLYALAMLFWLRGARLGTPGAFFVNSRASSAWGVAASLVVSSVGASATLSVAGLAFAVGMPAFWWLGSGAIGLVLLSLLLAGKVRKSRAYTLPELVESLMGRRARTLVSIIIVLAWTAILAAQFSAIMRVLVAMTGLPAQACMAVGFILIVLHSMGGQGTVMRLDRMQVYFIFFILLVLFAVLMDISPEWPGAFRFELVNDDFTSYNLFYMAVVAGSNYLVCPMLFGRMLSARDEGSARLGGLMGAAGLALCGLVIAAIGVACRGLVPPDTHQDAVLTSALASALPHWLNLLASVAWISAIVSSADSCLITAAAVLSHDLVKSDRLATGRMCVIGLGLAGFTLSLYGESILSFLFMAYGVFGCGVVAPVFIGLMLQDRRRIDPAFACAAICLGGAFGVAAALAGVDEFNFAGMAASAMLTCAGIRKEAFEPEAMPERA